MQATYRHRYRATLFEVTLVFLQLTLNNVLFGFLVQFGWQKFFRYSQAGRSGFYVVQNKSAKQILNSWGFCGHCELPSRSRAEPWFGFGAKPLKVFPILGYILMETAPQKTQTKCILLTQDTTHKSEFGCHSSSILLEQKKTLKERKCFFKSRTTELH